MTLEGPTPTEPRDLTEDVANLRSAIDVARRVLPAEVAGAVVRALSQHATALEGPFGGYASLAAVEEMQRLANELHNLVSPNRSDPRVQALAELRLRRYHSEYSADHLTWHDFAHEVAEDLALLDSLPAPTPSGGTAPTPQEGA